MAPYGRLLKEEALKLNANPRLSAVLILLYPVKGAKRIEHSPASWRGKEHHSKGSAFSIYTVLILRTSDHGVHSGQVSFPGGKKEESDRSLEDTALREAEEEIGIKKNDVKVIGPLSELYIPTSGFLVQPFVGYLNKKPLFHPAKNEVAKLIEVSLDLIMDDGIVKETTILESKTQNQKSEIQIPYFDIHGEVVWGATAMIISELKKILKGIGD